MAIARPCKVLVAEDEGLIARDIANRLEAMGHKVSAIVSTAEEAVREAPGADVVLMDIRLDGPGDGIQAAELIRERCGKPVVFLTAHADHSTLERAKLAVPFGYVVKPVQTATLAATIDMAVYKHRMERELAGQRGLLDAVLASVADAIIVAGPAGDVQLMNRAAEVLTGWTGPTVTGKPILEVVPLFSSGAIGPGSTGRAEDPVPLALLRDEAIEIGRGTTLAVRDGKRAIVEGSAAPVHVNASLAGVVVTLRDVSTRQWQEGQLRLAHKMEAAGRLAAEVSGEYANLLAVIRSRAARLIEQFPESVVVRRTLEEVEQAAVAAETITRRLACLGGRQLPNPEVFSLNGLLRRTKKLVESIAGGKVTVAMQIDPAAGKIWADAAQMEQVLMNLVIHASASISRGESMDDPAGEPADPNPANHGSRRQLQIETSNAEMHASGVTRAFVRLAVTHSGHEPDADALFDPSPLEDDRMALALTHAIVMEHGGYLSAFPVAGRYCFEVLLPRYAGPEIDAAGAVPGPVPGVLLVEPNAALRRELQNYFEANGYLLLEASDSAEALTLAHLHEGSFDIVIATHAEAGVLAGPLKEIYPDLKVLKILDMDEPSEASFDVSSGGVPSGDVIRRPFTQSALLEWVRAQLEQPGKPQAATAG
jgi:two-component system cell cycle sensor histidine kinase/response regulator CckA